VSVQADDQHYEQQHHRACGVEPSRGTGCSGDQGRSRTRPRPAESRLGGGDGHQPGRQMNADRVDERQKSTQTRRLMTSLFQHALPVSCQLYTHHQIQYCMLTQNSTAFTPYPAPRGTPIRCERSIIYANTCRSCINVSVADFVYTIQPVVISVEQPVEQPAASCKQTFNRLFSCKRGLRNHCRFFLITLQSYSSAVKSQPTLPFYPLSRHHKHSHVYNPNLNQS